jgi:hypothetical protein
MIDQEIRRIILLKRGRREELMKLVSELLKMSPKEKKSLLRVLQEK